MSGIMVFGALSGATIALIIFLTIRRLLRMGRYERAVKAHLGDKAGRAYDEMTMIYFYDHGMRAADAAREMAGAYRGP